MEKETYLLLFYCGFLIILFIIPSYLTYRRSGINPVQFGKDDTAINYVGKVYRYISAGAFLTVILNALFPKMMIYLIPIRIFEIPYIYWTGLILLHLSMLWIFIAQRNMAENWRIGIDKKNEINLVTNGLFRRTRNPIFIGVSMVFFALFLVIPNVLTVSILISGVIVVQIQVRLEEEFLLDEFGAEYQTYLNQVNRWIS